MNYTSEETGTINIDFLTSIVDALPNAVIVANKERQIIAVNKAFKDIFGYDSSEVLGHKTVMLYARQDDYTETGKTKFNPLSNFKDEVYEVAYQQGAVSRRNGGQRSKKTSRERPLATLA